MNDAYSKTLKARNLGIWVVAALLYPLAHWIPTASGHPPRILDVLIPIIIIGQGITSNSMVSAAIKKGRSE